MVFLLFPFVFLQKYFAVIRHNIGGVIVSLLPQAYGYNHCNDNMKLQILFGGELAQSVSERVTSLMVENGHEIAACLCMSEYKKANLELITIYIVQTIENDQAPESATKFFSFAKNKSHPVDLFSKLQYSVIALGDSNLLQDRQVRLTIRSITLPSPSHYFTFSFFPVSDRQLQVGLGKDSQDCPSLS